MSEYCKNRPVYFTNTYSGKWAGCFCKYSHVSKTECNIIQYGGLAFHFSIQLWWVSVLVLYSVYHNTFKKTQDIKNVKQFWIYCTEKRIYNCIWSCIYLYIELYVFTYRDVCIYIWSWVYLFIHGDACIYIWSCMYLYMELYIFINGAVCI